MVNFTLGKIVLTSDGRICEVKTRRSTGNQTDTSADRLQANRLRNEASNGCQLQNLVFTNMVQEDKNSPVEKPLARSDLRRKFCPLPSCHCYPWSL
ncbi:hypothetical protein ALC53_08467 [Atta colombica]|uniref:Uncharacterized protein n=1 Tax=Atta colombica TaxID=520822 RepID=A0A195BAA4_9HYME|nr:hypothetical protein ALC53_08467 [Atta colombica]